MNISGTPSVPFLQPAIQSVLASAHATFCGYGAVAGMKGKRMVLMGCADRVTDGTRRQGYSSCAEWQPFCATSHSNVGQLETAVAGMYNQLTAALQNSVTAAAVRALSLFYWTKLRGQYKPL